MTTGTELETLVVGDSEGDAESEVEETTETTETTEEPDYKALLEVAQGELATERATREKSERDQRSRDIQFLQKKQLDDMAAKTYAMTLAIYKKQNSGELNETQAQDAIRQGVEDIQQETTSTTTAETFKANMGTAQTKLVAEGKALGLGDALEDERADNVRLMWNEAFQAFQDGKFDVAEVRQRDAFRELSIVEKAIKAAPTRKGGMSLNARNGGGSAAGQSDQSLVNRFSKGEPMSVAEMVRAAKAMDNGIYPK